MASPIRIPELTTEEVAVNKVTYAGKTLIDLTEDTITHSTMLKGRIAHDSKGAIITGSIPKIDRAVPTIEVSPQGLITASVNQASGYVVSGDPRIATMQLDKQAGKVVTPSTELVTAVEPSKYTTGTVYVKGDTNLKAGNIKNGVSIFGVEGTLAPAPAETWVINESPTTGGIQQFDVGFTSNNTAYTVFCLGAYVDSTGTTRNAPIIYAKSDNSYVAAYKVGNTWSNTAYRTVTFDTAPTGALLTWLQANATKKLTVQESKSVTITENGTTTVTPDSDYESLRQVSVNVNVKGFPNGTEWMQSNITSGRFRDIVNADGIWVAAGYSNNGLYYSTDGKTWTQSNIASGNFYSIVNANGVWVTEPCDDTLGLHYSTDGKAWTQSNITSGDFYRVVNANGLWVAAGYSNNGLHYSTDGKTWTQSNITSSSFGSIINANGVWIVSTYSDGLYYSTDGKTWTQSNITSEGSMARYANGTYITIYGYYSIDGKTWAASNLQYIDPESLINANGLWVANDSSAIYYSTDGVTWTQSNMTGKGVSKIVYANGVLVGGSGSGYGLVYSTDGKTWTQSNITSGRFESIVNANGIWIAASSSKSDDIYYSADGKTWSKCELYSEYVKFSALANANGVWVGCHYDDSTIGLYYSVAWEPS